jgi:uncharacterized alkaline shock family protein YloU
MTATPPPPAPSTSPSSQSGAGAAGRPPSTVVEPSKGGALQTDRGTTSISSAVVAKIAGLATQEIPGVQAMGKSMTRAFGSIRSKIPGGGTSATSQGVSVEVGERQAAVDIDIVAYYGQSIVETADAIRQNVISQIEAMTGLEVVEVNVAVDDLYIPSDGDDDTQSSRVA